MAATKIAGVALAGMLAGMLPGMLPGAVLPAGAQTQGQTQGPFGGFKHDRSAPIEITSNALEVHQAENLAIFTGDVVAGQATMRLTADRVEVLYDQQGGQQGSQAGGQEAAQEGGQEGADANPGAGDIRNLKAFGNVFISNGAETAQGEQAEYNVETGIITMTGSVVLTQGQNVISGQRLVIHVDEGQGRMEGRVKSIFKPQQTSGQDTN